MVLMLALTSDDGRYPVRVWAAEALTGTILGEILPMSGSSWTVALDGGQCQLGVQVGLRLRDDSDWDWAAASHLRGLLDPGRRTLVATHGDACLGEWLIVGREPVDATTIRVTGQGWEAYPSRRMIHTTRKWKGTDQTVAVRRLLLDAYNGITVTIPTPATVGQPVTETITRWSSDYGQALDQLCDTDNGTEWRIKPAVTWSAGTPVAVTRTVIWGHPEIATATTVVASRPPAGERGGSAADVARAESLDRAVSEVRVLGAGAGKKQKTGAANSTMVTTAAGWVPVTTPVSLPAAKSASAATRKAARLVTKNLGQLVVPAPVVLAVDEIPGVPEIGDLITLDIAPTPAMPTGLAGTLRVGQITWTVDAGTLDRINLQGVDQ